MPEIERYTMQLVDHWPVDLAEEPWTELREEPHPGGRFVKHDNHLTALQQQRKQVIAEVEEALTGDEAVDAAEGELAHAMKDGPVESRFYILEAIQAALATLTKGGTDV